MGAMKASNGLADTLRSSVYEDIARVAHEVNRAYCQALGDDSQPAWEDAPQWQKDSILLGVKLHSENNVGPEASHESWLDLKTQEGWVYGETKNPETKEHPCMVPYNQLPATQKLKITFSAQ